MNIKKTWNRQLSVPPSKALANAHRSWTDNARVHAEYDLINLPSDATSDCIHTDTIIAVARWVDKTTPNGHLPLQSSRLRFCKFARFKKVSKLCVSKRLLYVSLPLLPAHLRLRFTLHKKILTQTSAWTICTRLRKLMWEDTANVRINYEQFAEYVNYYDNSVLFCENFQIIALNIPSWAQQNTIYQIRKTKSLIRRPI